MKLLSGSELSDYIKVRQAKQVRGLSQAWHVDPVLVIIRTSNSKVIDAYIRLKQLYADDLGVKLVVHDTDEDSALELIKTLNKDESVHGIIIQLPLADENRTDELINAVAPEKDVDALGSNKYFDPATPMAINWLLAGYNVSLDNKRIVLVGAGRLVGKPLADMWQKSGYDVVVVAEPTDDLSTIVKSADIVVSATGVPGLITSDMLRPEAVVVDAGTASEGGKLIGDVHESVRERSDLTITPKLGGVGPLTICALFDNVIRSARRVADAKSEVEG